MPSNLEQIIKCVEYCYKHDVPIVPVGARTGLEGGIHAMKGGVAIDMTQTKAILKMHKDDMDCHVEAGINWRELNESIKSSGLWFPVDPGASASIGGMTATCASGTNAVRFGTMKENVIGANIVIKDGKLISTSGITTRSKKSSAGLDLTHVFVGSEGTLGLITSARLKLHPLPNCIAIATVSFKDTSTAIDSVLQIMKCGIPVARIEYLDKAAVNACYLDSKLESLNPKCDMLFIELHAFSDTGLNDQIEILEDIVNSNGGSNFLWSSKQEERTQLWKARHNLHWSIVKTKPGFGNIDTDVCVPISNFPKIVSVTHKLIEKYKLDGPLMGHAGDGNFHSVILFDPNKPGDFDKAKCLANDIGKAAIALEGTVTGEHGIGRGKMDLLEMQFDEESLNAMYMLKKTFDPKNLFNPDKMFKADKLSSY